MGVPYTGVRTEICQALTDTSQGATAKGEWEILYGYTSND